MKNLLGKMDATVVLPVMLLVLLMGFTAYATAAQTGDNRINRYVVAVSANNGGGNRPMLRYAESDAKSFANVLKEMGGVQPQNVILVKQPTIENLKQEFQNLDKKILQVKSAGGRNEVLIYYSGHADDKGLRLGEETYAWKEFRSRIDSLNADVKIAVIDACGSGAITRAKGGVAVPAFMVDESSDMKGYAFITSSTQDEASQESDRLKGSFFTHSLVSGLRGAGDISGDGRVTLSEAYQFAFNETLHKTEATIGGAQHPSRDMNLAGTGDVVMTDLHGTGALLDLKSDVEGRLFIRNINGELVAELNKKNGHPISLGLPAGKYIVRLEVASSVRESVVELTHGKKQTLSMSNFKQVNVENTVLRGEIGGKRFCSPEDSVKCSLDSLDHNGVSRTTFNLYDHEKEPRKGVQLGLFFTKADEYMLGSQVSILANIVEREMHGLQLSAIANIAEEHFEGAQINSTVNYAESFDGLQLSGTVNVTVEKSKGLQIGPFNVALDTLSVAQIGAINFADQTPVQVGVFDLGNDCDVQVSVINFSRFSDVQVSLINVAQEVTKAQVGIINNAAHSIGTQWGFINFTGVVDGVQGGFINVVGSAKDHQIGFINASGFTKERQWGFINVAVHADKTPVGVINIVGNGLWTVSGLFNEMGNGGLKLDLGTAYFYTSLETERKFERGESFREFDDLFINGFGVGTHFGKYGSHFALEYMFMNVNTKYHFNYGMGKKEKYSPSYLHRIRFGSTYKLFTGVGLTGGISLNLATQGYANENRSKPLGDYHADVHVDGETERFWPGFYAGITLGRF